MPKWYGLQGLIIIIVIMVVHGLLAASWQQWLVGQLV
jgi:hypothetical protein